MYGGSRGYVLCVNAMDCLVIINNYEEDCIQSNFAQSTQFNPPLQWYSAHSAHAWVGSHGSPVDPKVFQNDFSKIVPKPLGELKQVV